jgi:spore germination cell wall hydrolase CwlJ-like protein
MSFLHRAATIAAILATFTGLAGASTPSFAVQISQSNNAPAATMVPAVLVTQTTESSATPAVDQVDPAEAQPAPNYASLDAAVAAQSDSTEADDVARNDALQCLAGAIYFESKGEPLSGQLAVAEVVINRSKSGKFPGSICSVVTQPGQFSFVRGGRVPDISDNHNYRVALAVARVALNDAWDSPAPKALFFHARHASFSASRTQVASIGNHIFYR